MPPAKKKRKTSATGPTSSKWPPLTPDCLDKLNSEFRPENLNNYLQLCNASIQESLQHVTIFYTYNHTRQYLAGRCNPRNKRNVLERFDKDFYAYPNLWLMLFRVIAELTKVPSSAIKQDLTNAIDGIYKQYITCPNVSTRINVSNTSTILDGEPGLEGRIILIIDKQLQQQSHLPILELDCDFLHIANSVYGADSIDELVQRLSQETIKPHLCETIVSMLMYAPAYLQKTITPQHTPAQFTASYEQHRRLLRKLVHTIIDNKAAAPLSSAHPS